MSNTTTETLEEPRTNVARGYAWVWHLVPVVLVALAIRLVVVYFYYQELPDANQHYEQFGWEVGWVARALASGHGFSSPYYPMSGATAEVPPLYTSLLAGVFRLFGIYSLTSAFIVLSINSLLSSLTAIPVYFSAEYSLGARGARISAWVWAFYPFAIYFSAGRVWEYSLTCLLLTTCLCIAQRIHLADNSLAWLGWGALYGLTALSNPAVLSTLPFLLVLALFNAHRSGRRWVAKGALSFFTAVAVLIPWTVLNYRALGVLCPVCDLFWMEAYVDNFGNAYLDRSSPPSAGGRPYPATDPVEMHKFLTMGEPAYMAERRALSLNELRNHPRVGFLAYKTLRRFFYYWTGYWSFSAAELQDQPYEPFNVFYVGVMTLLMLRGIGRFWRRNRDALLPYLALIVFFPLVYYITNPLMDYRQAIEPAIVILAVAGAFPLRRMRAGDADGKCRAWIGAERMP